MDPKTEKVEEKTELEKALDESLATIEAATKPGEDTISKGGKPPFPFKKKGEKKDDEKDEEKDEEKKEEGEDAKGCAKEEEEAAKGDEKKEEEEDEEEGAVKKGMAATASERLAKSEVVNNAIEVSKFLRDVVKSLGEMEAERNIRLRRIEKSLESLGGALVKSFGAQADVIKSLGSDVSTLGSRALPRKAALAGQTIEKSFRGDPKDGDKPELSKSEVAGRLAQLEMENKVPMGTTTRYETAGVLSKGVEELVFKKAE